MLDIPSSFISIPSSFISINFFHWHCRAGYFNMFQQSFLPPLQPFGENSPLQPFGENVTKCVHVFPEICGSKNSHVCTFHDLVHQSINVSLLQISVYNLNLNKLFMYILGVVTLICYNTKQHRATPPTNMISPLMTS